ncbi:MAG: filamentous hemagglutinin N-terminal domain-containing protein [Xenococcus sp. (in: cyanobacteria)]
MSKKLPLLLSLACCTISQGIFLTSAMAQVIPDGTTSTTVDVNGNDLTINQGDRAGGNLFHSFVEFSVPSGAGAFFNNAADIVNIFSRVTGGNISNIDGLLRANGSANLFLLNPAGIIFGENARLDIGGSFYGSTADSILFSDGEFSAANLDNPPLLTINAPIGLNFRDDPADIVSRSGVTSVQAGEILALVGGNIFLENSAFNLDGGQIILGGLSSEGEVRINSDGSLSFPNNVSLADVQLTNSLLIETDNFALTNGSFLDSSTFGQGNAGNILINASNIDLDQAFFNSQVGEDAIGNGGDIEILSQNINLTNNSSLSTITSGLGNAGSVTINTADSLGVFGGDTTGSLSIFTRVAVGAQGNAGDININASSIFFGDGATLDSSTFGEGDAGNITVNILESLTVGLGSNISSQVAQTATGNGGNISLNTSFLDIFDGGQINASVFGQGNAGDILIASEDISIDGESLDGFGSGIFSQVVSSGIGNGGIIEIKTSNLDVTNGGQISVATFGLGDGGSLNIDVFDTLNLADGAILSFSGAGSLGNAGGININASSLTIINGGSINAGTLGQGDGGNININASEFIGVAGRNQEGLSSGILANSGQSSLGNAGNIFVNTKNFNIANSGNLTVDSQGLGNGGNAIIIANSLELNNNASISSTSTSGFGGNTSIRIADNLILKNNSTITAGAFQDADGGNVNILAGFIIAFPSQIPINGNDIIANAEQGFGGNILISSKAILNIEERAAIPGNGTNDIDASSEFGLDGFVSVPPFDTDLSLSQSILTDDQTLGRNACSGGRATEASSFIVKGKGGIPPIPTEPFDSDDLLVDEQITTSNLQTQYPDIKPIKTSIGDIYPARGIIKTEDGKILLTAYPTDNINTRTPHISANCTSS